MDKLSWRDWGLGLLVGAVLWQPFSLTGLLGGMIPAAVVVCIGCALSLPILKSFNRKFPRDAAGRGWSKFALIACAALLALMMKLVIEGGLASAI